MDIQVSSEAQRTAEVRVRHRQERQRQITLPVAAAAIVLFIVIPLALLILFSDRQVSIIAAFATVMVVLPVVLLCLVPYVLLLVLVAVMLWVYRRAPNALRTGRNVAHGVNLGTHRVSAAATAPVIAVSKRLAWLERLTGNDPPHAR